MDSLFNLRLENDKNGIGLPEPVLFGIVFKSNFFQVSDYFVFVHIQV